MTGNLKKWIVGAITGMTVFAALSTVVSAAEPHEDPEKAALVFSGIALFRYYSDSLDLVLQKNPDEVAVKLEKTPFANIPDSLKDETEDFALSVTDISRLIALIDENLNRLNMLVQQFRIEEATELASATTDNISLANKQLKVMEQAIVDIGEDMEISTVPEQSDLQLSYDEVLEKIGLIREMLVMYQELVDSAVIAAEGLLGPTDITLEVKPKVAFVGDNIQFEGILTFSGNQPLAGREVDILLNGSRYVTVQTDTQGYYRGSLQVPYLYIPEMKIQALYYPRDEDIGRYIASLSPVIKLEVLFYEAELELTVEDKAYPGLETTITGRFDYGQPSPAGERNIEIYVDDILIEEAAVQDEFTLKIKLDPSTDTGKHVITVSSAATGRYSPVVSSVILNVTRAIPVLDLDVPGFVLIPGSIEIQGRIYSGIGTLGETSIEMELGNSGVQLVSSEDGTFNTDIDIGTRWIVIGSQDLVIHVFPGEPWHAPLTASRNILVVNMLNLGIIAVIIIICGIFLPGLLRGRVRGYTRKRAIPETVPAQPEPEPVYSERITAISEIKRADETTGTILSRIFYWYRLLVRFIQERTRALIRPQQTLREFAVESSHALGPAARYFTELTRIGERLLYSQYEPTQEDAEKTENLYHRILEESGPESTEPQSAVETDNPGEKETGTNNGEEN